MTRKSAFLVAVSCAAYLLIGCGAGSGGGGTTAASVKSLWSVWKSTTTSLTLNLTGGALGVTETYTLTTASGANCSCSFFASGTESSGSYALSACAYSSGGGGDPGCAGLDSSGTYTKTATQLTCCDGGGCVTYQ